MTRRAAVLLRVHDAPWGCSLGALIDEQKHFDAPTRFRLAFRELGTCLGVRVQCHPGRSASPATAPSDKFTAAEENLEKAEEEERVRVAAEKAAANKAKTSSTATKSTPVASSASASVATPKGNAQDMERLGMGFKRLGFGAVPAAAASSRCVSRVDLVENYAEHFRGCPQFASLGGCADLRAR